MIDDLRKLTLCIFLQTLRETENLNSILERPSFVHQNARPLISFWQYVKVVSRRNGLPLN